MSEVIKKEKGLSLGDRMKKYEDVSRFYLTPKQPAIVRVDGRAFHTYTKQKWCKKPYSDILIRAFQRTTLKVCEETMNVCFAFHQSDEVSFLLKDYERKEQQQLFGGNIQKIATTFASKFTAHFNQIMIDELRPDYNDEYPALGEFDARVFTAPLHEATNYFIWRQQDWIKNSITQYSMSFFSDKQLHNKNSDEKKKMIIEKGEKAWDDLENHLKYGTFFRKEKVELKLNEVSEDQRKYINKTELVEIPEYVVRNRWMCDFNSPILLNNKEYLEKIVYYIEEGHNELI